MDINKELSETSSTLYVLSTLMRKPLLLEETEYVLTPDDFVQPLQQILFTSIFNMEKNGARQLTPQDVDLYVKTQPSVYQYYNDNKGYEWLQSAYKLTDNDESGQFKYYYTRLKKFSVLRDLVRAGIDIKEFYDVNIDLLDRDVQDDKLDKISIDEIINTVRERLVNIEDRNIGKTIRSCQTVDENVESLIDSFKDTPDVGLPMQGEYLNVACRGARLGKFYLFSASSGSGKTRQLVGNALSLSMPRIINHHIVARTSYEKVLYVSTEQTIEEIQTMAIAYITGINEDNVKTYNYTASELVDIGIAKEILREFGKNFLIEYMPDATTAAVSVCLTKHILQDKTQYIFFDYISSGTGLLNEFRDLKIREDVALRLMATKFKEIAATYNVFVYSGTQTNRGTEDMPVRNENCIEGSKAVANKADFGMVCVRLLPGSEEMEQIDQIVKQGNYIRNPNQVIDVYKNRGGRLSKVKLFRYFDYGTCRATDLFITDTDYKLYVDIDGKPISKSPVTSYEATYNSLKEWKEGIVNE